MKMKYLYKIYNINSPDKIYIGTTNNLKTRLAQHKRDSNSILLKEDMKSLGSDDFRIKELYSSTDSSLILYHEKKLITKLAPYYNNTYDKGGELGKATCGEDHYNSKLCEDNIKDICARGVLGETANSIQKDYPSVSSHHINHIIIGRAWSHLTNIPRREPYTKKHHIYYELTEQEAANICFKVVEDGELEETMLKQYPCLNAKILQDILRGRLFPNINAPRLKARKCATKEEVLEIRNLAFSGKTAVDIHKEYFPDKGVQMLRNIISGKTLKYSKMPGPIKGADY